MSIKSILLDDRDIENFRVKEKVDREVQPKIDEALENIIDNAYKENNANRDEIETSYMKQVRLEFI